MKFKGLFTSSISFVAIALWCISVQAAPPNWPPTGLDIAQAVQAKHGNELMGIEGVVGHGITVDKNSRAAIVVFTERPLVTGIPGVLDAVPVLKRFTGRFYALAPPLCGGPPSQRPPDCFEDPDPGIDPKARFDRPVPIGVSTGHPDITAGTIGARVVDASGTLHALSNNHVIADTNGAATGNEILQPGPYDGGTQSDDVYAHLSFFVPIDFSGSNNTMDAAIAVTDDTQLGNATPSDGYGAPANTTTTPVVGQSVQKYGRTTSLTNGSVEAVNVTVDVCYEGSPFCTKLATFVNQISIVDGTFSAGGDSGSLVVTSVDKQPVALLFAGSSSHTIATPIDTVLSAFAVTIDGEEYTPPPPGSGITLSTNGYKVKGQQKADLTWTGANTGTGNVFVYRDGTEIDTTSNDGAYTDPINNKGGGSYTYQVCEAVTDGTCSNESVVTF